MNKHTLLNNVMNLRFVVPIINHYDCTGHRCSFVRMVSRLFVLVSAKHYLATWVCSMTMENVIYIMWDP